MKKTLAIFGVLVALATAMPAQASPVNPERQFDSWAVRCEGAGTARKCEIYQRLVLAETGQRVIEFAISYPERKMERGNDIAPASVAAHEAENGMAHGVVVLPLGIMLPDGVSMNIDKRQRFQFQVRYCTSDGCYAYLDMPRPVIDSLRRGMAANITFRTLDKEDVTLPMSLKGFGGALQAIQ